MAAARTQIVQPRGTQHENPFLPQITYNHNETLIRRQFGVNDTEKRARPYISVNHNETLIRR